MSSPASLLHRNAADVDPAIEPDRLLDGSVVDAFSWRAPAAASRSRRAAILIWGFGYIGAGRSFLSLAFRQRSILVGLIGLLVFAAGTRILLNAIPAHRDP